MTKNNAFKPWFPGEYRKPAVSAFFRTADLLVSCRSFCIHPAWPWKRDAVAWWTRNSRKIESVEYDNNNPKRYYQIGLWPQPIASDLKDILQIVPGSLERENDLKLPCGIVEFIKVWPFPEIGTSKLPKCRLRFLWFFQILASQEECSGIDVVVHPHPWSYTRC